MKPKPHPPQEVLKSLFDYDVGGHLVWKKTGKVAGRDQPLGYRQIGIAGKIYYAHRLVWIWHNGDPGDDMHVDHLNHERADNRIENLQVLTGRRNISRRVGRDGLTGVYEKSSDCFIAQVWFAGKNRYLGRFPKLSEAKLAYDLATDIIEAAQKNENEKG